ncbi:MAG: deoxyribodipyrimidine photolyase [Candidatus Eremiobacteraeota bacterium]|nr:deoxyribodipyrimidine photolyase [Candidatus Eremiobacteraeota bacterium]MCW5865815.1 deoxyribodipyrimidine photolyase [Candidatus Eremiobacteraeota bacterium]
MYPAFHSQVPEIRRWPANEAGVHREGEFVLYWMTANRRPTFNFSLQRAVEWARHLQKPLLILEALRRAYPWACQRFHRWVMDGMEDNQKFFESKAVTYYPYLEPEHGDGRGLLESLAERACVVVGDHFPCFFLPHMIEKTARRLKVHLELVDSNGLLPLNAAPKTYLRAVDFRRFLQKSLKLHLKQRPEVDSLKGLHLPRLPERLPEYRRWKPGVEFALSDLPEPAPVQVRGGSVRADRLVTRFLNERLENYHRRSQPSQQVASGFSPYLHWGHLSAHQVFQELAEAEDFDPEGWPARMSANADSFLDELITWRELGYNMCHRERDYDSYESLPDWARATLEEHAADERPYLYTLKELDEGRTYDPIWNAAQRQLREEGYIHNYLRMLWGKKILEWSQTPRQAVAHLIELNNKYSLDGRNPNSYSGIFWCLGRYDRAWFERPIFGKIRYMSSESTARKFKLGPYLERFG